MMIAPHEPYVELIPQPRRRRPRLRQVLAAVCVLLGLALAALVVLPSALGLSGHVVRDDAMSGSISAGSMIFTKPVPVADLVVGDVISYLPPDGSGVDEVVTRRVSAIEHDAFTTARDVDGVVDPWTVRFDDPIQQQVVLDLPVLGSVADAVTSSWLVWGLGLPFALLALVVLGEAVVRRWPARAPERAPRTN